MSGSVGASAQTASKSGPSKLRETIGRTLADLDLAQQAIEHEPLGFAVKQRIVDDERARLALGGTAKQMADKNASAAVVAILAPMCADKFRQGADASANMAELKKVSSWMQDSYIEKGGWATFPGNGSPDRSVAQACATLLTALQ